MKKLVLIMAVAIMAFSLYSFKGLDQKKKSDVEITNITLMKEAANFSKSYKTFSDKFTAWRQDWVDYDEIKTMSSSVDKMEAVLNGL